MNDHIEMLQLHIWNLYYEVHGFRPRHLPLNEWSELQLQQEINKLDQQLLEMLKG